MTASERIRQARQRTQTTSEMREQAEALDALADNETADEAEYYRLRAEAARIRESISWDS